ncbi:trypsin-like peptidase domain-containing protein [Myxosarcina sp. GI1(2024)]
MYNFYSFSTLGIIVTISPIPLSGRSPLVAATPQAIARPITVQIVGQSNRGSGVIISRDSNKFTILTNAHVVSQSDNYQAITADGVSHQIGDRTIIPNLDLALLSFTSNNNYTVAAIDNSLPSVGETIYVAGWPRSGGSLRQPIFKLTSGEIRQTDSSLTFGYTLTYTNLVRAGMSGGAILNAAGKLIGINGLVRLDESSNRAIASGIAIDTYLQWRGGENHHTTTTSSPNAEQRVDSGNYTLAKISLASGIDALVYNDLSQTVISGSSAGKIDIWHSATGKHLSSWQAHQSSVNAIALAENGKMLATGGEDGTIFIWDLAGGQLLHILKGHRGAITDLVFGTDDNTLFSSSWDGTIRQWQISTGKTDKIFEGHGWVVNAIALSPDGKTLASGGQDGIIRLWDVAGGDLQATLPGHSLAVLALDISADGKNLVSGSGDGTIKLWNLDTHRAIDTLEGHTDGVWQVELSADSRTLVSGSWDKTVRVWNLKTGTLLNTLAEHRDYIGALTISSDGKMFVSGDWQGQIYLWRAKI